MIAHLRAVLSDAELRARASAATASRPFAPATPARIACDELASRYCCTRRSRAAECAIAFFGIEPGFGVLERRGHLLPRHRARAAARGHRITFYEPDAYERQQHRDIDDPPWAKVVVYPGDGRRRARAPSNRARGADLIVKASGVGVFDELLEAAVLDLQTAANLVAFWDVDAPATLDRVHDDPRRSVRCR